MPQNKSLGDPSLGCESTYISSDADSGIYGCAGCITDGGFGVVDSFTVARRSGLRVLISSSFGLSLLLSLLCLCPVVSFAAEQAQVQAQGLDPDAPSSSSSSSSGVEASSSGIEASGNTAVLQSRRVDIEEEYQKELAKAQTLADKESEEQASRPVLFMANQTVDNESLDSAPQDVALLFPEEVEEQKRLQEKRNLEALARAEDIDTVKLEPVHEHVGGRSMDAHAVAILHNNDLSQEHGAQDHMAQKYGSSGAQDQAQTVKNDFGHYVHIGPKAIKRLKNNFLYDYFRSPLDRVSAQEADPARDGDIEPYKHVKNNPSIKKMWASKGSLHSGGRGYNSSYAYLAKDYNIASGYVAYIGDTSSTLASSIRSSFDDKVLGFEEVDGYTVASIIDSREIRDFFFRNHLSTGSERHAGRGELPINKTHMMQAARDIEHGLASMGGGDVQETHQSQLPVEENRNSAFQRHSINVISAPPGSASVLSANAQVDAITSEQGLPQPAQAPHNARQLDEQTDIAVAHHSQTELHLPQTAPSLLSPYHSNDSTEAEEAARAVDDLQPRLRPVPQTPDEHGLGAYIEQATESSVAGNNGVETKPQLYELTADGTEKLVDQTQSLSEHAKPMLGPQSNKNASNAQTSQELATAQQATAQQTSDGYRFDPMNLQDVLAYKEKQDHEHNQAKQYRHSKAFAHCPMGKQWKVAVLQLGVSYDYDEMFYQTLVGLIHKGLIDTSRVDYARVQAHQRYKQQQKSALEMIVRQRQATAEIPYTIQQRDLHVPQIDANVDVPHSRYVQDDMRVRYPEHALASSNMYPFTLFPLLSNTDMNGDGKTDLDDFPLWQELTRYGAGNGYYIPPKLNFMYPNNYAYYVELSKNSCFSLQDDGYYFSRWDLDRHQQQLSVLADRAKNEEIDMILVFGLYDISWLHAQKFNVPVVVVGHDQDILYNHIVSACDPFYEHQIRLQGLAPLSTTSAALKDTFSTPDDASASAHDSVQVSEADLAQSVQTATAAQTATAKTAAQSATAAQVADSVADSKFSGAGSLSQQRKALEQAPYSSRVIQVTSPHWEDSSPKGAIPDPQVKDLGDMSLPQELEGSAKLVANKSKYSSSVPCVTDKSSRVEEIEEESELRSAARSELVLEQYEDVENVAQEEYEQMKNNEVVAGINASYGSTNTNAYFGGTCMLNPMANKPAFTLYEFSPYPNIHVQLTPIRHFDDIEHYQRIFKFKRLGVIVDNSEIYPSLHSVNEIEGVMWQLGGSTLVCQSRFITPNVKAAARDFERCVQFLAKEDVEAVYLMRNNGSTIHRLYKQLRPLIDKDIPVFSRSGSAEVKSGALMSWAYGYEQSFGRFESNVISQIMHGIAPTRISQYFFPRSIFTVNARIANEISWIPHYLDLLRIDVTYLDVVSR